MSSESRFSALASAFLEALAGADLTVSAPAVACGGGGAVSSGSTKKLLSAKERADFFREKAIDYQDEREYKYSAPTSPFARATAKAKRKKLAARALGREAGLSNAAYLAVTSGTRKVRLTCDAAGVKFSLFDALHELMPSCPAAPGGKRGKIEELSEASKRRMGACAFGLSARGYEPELFITLTSPANWEQIYLEDGEETGGRIFKAHMFAFKKRFNRKLKKLGIHEWSGFWFLEFQKRGAPHLHLYVFNCKVSTWQLHELRAWAGEAWAEIVGNPDEKEYRKHAKAGTSIEKAKKKHFGYAAKYSKKESQKDVPEGFRDVGRFWGRWNVSRETPVILDYEININNKREIVEIEAAFIKALRIIFEKSPQFALKVFLDFGNFIRGHRIRSAFTLFGNDCTSAWLEALGSPPIDWKEV